MVQDTTIDWTEIEIEREYFIGLVDHLAKPKLRPQPGKTGYGLSPKVTLTVRKTEFLAGILTRIFSDLDISWRISYADSGPKRITISEQDSIRKIWEIGEGTYLQAGEKLRYLVHYIEKYKGKSLAGQPERFLKVFKPWADLHPEWNGRESRRYTLEFFKEEFEIDSVPDEEEVPSITYPDELSIPYFAGLFDARAWPNLSVHKGSDYSIGYSLAPIIDIQIQRPTLHMTAHMKKFFEDNGLSPSYSDENEPFHTVFSTVDGVESLIELIGPDIYYLYEVCELFYSQLIPAYRDGYHHSKEGFLDMLRAYRETTPAENTRKYDLEYFESKWGMNSSK